MTFVFEARGRRVTLSRGRTLMISSRATLTTLSAVIFSGRAWSSVRMRVVIGTPMSDRMSASSSSSQSTGRPVNFCMMDLKNPMAMRRAALACGGGARRAIQILFDAVQNAVHETAGFFGAEFFRDFDRLIDDDDGSDVRG